MEVTIEDIQNLAKTARIALTERELEKYRGELCELEALSAALLELPEGLHEGASTVNHSEDTLREDEVGVCLSAQQVLQMAGDSKASYVRVPRVVKGATL